ncbi:MAG: EthD family reductase [Dehalococcoidia bacterium]|nr:EthD family reductase [Dehalococcoidia bacterium]
MIRVSVMYPNEKGKRFDLDYFTKKHMALVHKLLDPAGLVKSEVDKAADPNAPFVAVAHLYFKSLEESQVGFATHAAEFMADMPNYTDLVPQVQFSEIVK